MKIFQKPKESFSYTAAPNSTSPSTEAPNTGYKAVVGGVCFSLAAPLAKWVYNYQAEPNSPEAELTEYYLKPQDWLGSELFGNGEFVYG